MKAEEFDLETLIGLAEELAVEEAGGHLSLTRFTTGWKVFLRTPDLDTGAGREEVAGMQSCETLKEAPVNLLLRR